MILYPKSALRRRIFSADYNRPARRGYSAQLTAADLHEYFAGGVPWAKVAMPSSANIKYIGDGTNLKLLIDDVEVKSEAVNLDISGLANKELIFTANLSGDGTSILQGIDDISLSYIKINDHQWTSPNWEAPVTTNSQGILTTLHSDVDTAAMIIEV